MQRRVPPDGHPNGRPQPFNPAAPKSQPPITIQEFVRTRDLPPGRYRPGARPLFGWLKQRAQAGVFFPRLLTADAFRDFIVTRVASPMMQEAANDVFRAFTVWKKRMERTGDAS